MILAWWILSYLQFQIVEKILPRAPNKIEIFLPIAQQMETTLPTVLLIVSYLQLQLLMQDELTSRGSTLFQFKEWGLDSYIRTSVSHMYRKHMSDLKKQETKTPESSFMNLLLNKYLSHKLSETEFRGHGT